MKLSIIIVSYNVRHYLEQCLSSVMDATKGIQSEIIIVDNDSTDGSPQMLKEKFFRFQLIFNDKNLGFSKANNQALKIAKGEYVLLLNPDTLVDENTFAKSIEFMDAHPEAGGLGVKMINGKGSYLQESKRGFPTPATAFYRFSGLSKLFPKSKRFNKYYLGHLDANEIQEIEVLAGAYMFLRKTILDKIGLLDESFFMYGEDIDLSYRITQAGYKNYYLPEAIIHYKGESAKKSNLNYVLFFYKAMLIFSQKHFSKKTHKFLFFLIYPAVYLKAFLTLSLRVFRSFSKQLSRLLENITRIKVKRIVVVGSETECKRIGSSINKLPRNKLVGYINPKRAIKRYPGFLGGFNQLKDILKIYKIDEVIFCINDPKLNQVLDKISELKGQSITYKFSHRSSQSILNSSQL